MGKQMEIKARRIRPLMLDAFAAVIVVVLVVGFSVFRLGYWHLRHPVFFQGDVGIVLEYVKNGLRNGGTTVDPQIGYPDYGTLAAFPVFDVLSAAVLKVISLFTADPVTGANLLVYADHVLSGLVGYACFRCLRIPRVSSTACAVAFAYVEFALQPGRVIAHETLQLIAPLAIGATLALLPVARPSLTVRREGWAAVLLGAGVIGMAQPYWVAFSLIVMAASIGGCLAAARFRGAALLVAASGTMLAVAAVCLVWPRLWGEPGLVIHRSPFEQPIFGLRVVNLLLPARSALFPGVNGFYSNYLANSGTVSEGFDAFVGWAGLVGLVFSIVLLLRLPFSRGGETTLAVSEVAAVLIVALIVFTHPYGFGELFNLLITPEIRAQNRVSPLIGFLAIFVFADVACRAGALQRTGRRVFAVTVPLVVALGLYDESAGIDYAALQVEPGTVRRWAVAEAAAKAVTDALPAGAKILQMPFMPFPESPAAGTLGSYDEMDLALFTKGMHYSFGATSNAPPFIDAQSPVSAAIDAAAIGYDEILIYKAGYPDGIEATAGPLRDVLHLQPNIDVPEFIGFDLGPLRDGLPSLDPAVLQVRTDWDGHGFSVFERDPNFTFRWDDSVDSRAAVVLDNVSSTPISMRFCGTVVSSSPGAYPVSVNVNGQVTHPPVNPAGVPLDVTFDAPPGRSMLSVAMPVPRLITAAPDPRRLHFQVRFPALVATSVIKRVREIRERFGLAPPRECS